MMRNVHGIKKSLIFVFDMVKPLKEMTFRPMGDFWSDKDGNVLADVLKRYGLVIDDRMQFGRFYDYDVTPAICIYYRASAGKVTITIWETGRL